MLLEFRFSHSYEVMIGGELDPQLPVIRFDAVEGERTKSPLKAEIRPQSASPWLGVFEGDTDTSEAVTGVFSHPDQNRFVAVSAGQGYIVDSNDPRNWEAIPYVPITNIRDVPTLDLIVLSDFLQLAAYDSTGLRWETERIAYDGIRFEDIRGGQLSGQAWSAPRNREVPFAVDLVSGTHEGGDSPGS